MIGRLFDLAFDVLAIVRWTFRGCECRAHDGESISEDRAAWARYRAAQGDRWFT